MLYKKSPKYCPGVAPVQPVHFVSVQYWFCDTFFSEQMFNMFKPMKLKEGIEAYVSNR